EFMPRSSLAEPEEARLGISFLRMRRDGPNLDEAETEAEHLLRNLGVLVEAGRETDGRRKIDPGHGRPQGIRKLRRIKPGHRLQARNGQAMGALCIERER